jgi:hypothetical protein
MAERASIRRGGMDGLVARVAGRYQRGKQAATGVGGAILTREANLARKIDSRSASFGFDYCAAKMGCCVIAAAGHLFFAERADDVYESNSVLCDRPGWGFRLSV